MIYIKLILFTELCVIAHEADCLHVIAKYKDFFFL